MVKENAILKSREWLLHLTWWRHQMETFSVLLALCAGNSPVPGEFPTQRPVTRSFDVFFDLRLNKQVSKQSWGWRFEPASSSLWRQCNEKLAPSRPVVTRTMKIEYSRPQWLRWNIAPTFNSRGRATGVSIVRISQANETRVKSLDCSKLTEDNIIKNIKREHYWSMCWESCSTTPHGVLLMRKVSFFTSSSNKTVRFLQVRSII